MTLFKCPSSDGLRRSTVWCRCFTAAVNGDATSQRNVTSLVDTALTLQCPLAAPKRGSARTAWQKRDNNGGWRRLFRRDSDRTRDRPTDLEFDRLLVSDAGLYRCSRTTNRGVIYSTPIALIVHGITVRLCSYCFEYNRNVVTRSSATAEIARVGCRSRSSNGKPACDLLLANNTKLYPHRFPVTTKAVELPPLIRGCL